MMNIALSERLNAVLETARDNTIGHKRIIDVGSDHGHLAARAVMDGIFESAVCTDIHKGPADKSASLMKDMSLSDKIKVYCTDGLDGVELTEDDTVVMAGLGGNNMVDIISRVNASYDKELLKTVTFILQPQKSIEVLREFLSQNAFAVTEETVVQERGIYYPILVTRYTGETYNLSLREKYYGPVLMKKFEAGEAVVSEYFIRLDSRYKIRARGDQEIGRLLEEMGND